MFDGTLTYFMPRSQLLCLREGLQGEEAEYFEQKINEYQKRAAEMPQTYDQDGLGMNAIAYLHYFRGGMDWYITEKDKERGKQHQAFGWANLGDPQNAELGYISIEELISNGVELDLHFEPKPLNDCLPQYEQDLDQQLLEAMAFFNS